MPRSRKGSRRSSRRRSRRSSRRNYKGGDGAAENMIRLVGDGETQFQNVFGPSNTSQSNVVVPIQSASTIQNSAPVSNAPVGGQTGAGKGKRRGRKGGFFGMGSVINQAVVPLAILGMQQTYGKNHHHMGARHMGTRRRRR